MYIENISAGELKQFIYNNQYEIIDVRDFYEFAQSHVINAVHVNSGNIMSGNLKKITKKNVIVYCDRGGESLRMAKILSGRGYSVINVIGGFNEIKNYADLIV